jgi:autotransporter-associated beta strand protein
VNNLWDVITSITWTDAGNPSGFYQLDAVTFNDTANNVAYLSGTLVPSVLTVSNSAPFTFGGTNASIGGVATLVKQGPGNLILTNGVNLYSGGTVISNGVLSVGSDSGNNQNDRALGTGPVTVNAGGELRFGGNSGAVVQHFITNAITVNGGVVKAQDGVQHLTNSSVTVTAAGGGLQTVFATKNLVLDAPLQGTGNITVAAVAAGTNVAGGQVILNNASNAFSGSIAIATNGNLALVGPAGLSNCATIDVQLGGILDVTARTNTAATLTLQSGQTLKGNGIVRGNVVALSGSTVSPGASIGTLTITNSVTNSITLAGLTYMEIDRSAAQNSDRIVASTNIIVGGTLTVVNLGAVLQANDSFQLFSRAVSGAFAATNLPALTAGLSWSNSVALNGRLTVVAGVNTTPTNIVASLSGGALTLSWPSDRTGWRLLVQTNNLQSGVSRNTNDWTTVVGSAATNRVSLTVDTNKPASFYRLVYP